MQTVAERLGVSDFGANSPVVGNFLLYPRRVILQVLKLAFKQPNLFTPSTVDAVPEDANPFLYVELEDGTLSTDSRLVIADFNAEDLVRGEGRPRIVVHRMQGTFMNQSALSRTNTYTRATNSKRFSDIFESSLIIRCVGSNRPESELLALSVSSIILFFSDEIRRKSDLHFLGTPTVAETQLEKADSGAEQYCTAVSLSVSQTFTWTKSKINTTVLASICPTVTKI